MKDDQHFTATAYGLAGYVTSSILGFAMLSGCSQSFGEADRVVRTEDGRLAVSEQKSQNTSTHEVAMDAKTTLDGQPAQLPDLEQGDAAPHDANNPESAELNTRAPASAGQSYQGTISEMSESQFVVTNDSGKEMTFKVTDDTNFVVNGNEGTFDQLAVEDVVSVIAQRHGDHFVASMVDVTSGDTNR